MAQVQTRKGEALCVLGGGQSAVLPVPFHS